MTTGTAGAAGAVVATGAADGGRIMAGLAFAAGALEA
jgi:hypothetical protein